MTNVNGLPERPLLLGRLDRREFLRRSLYSSAGLAAGGLLNACAGGNKPSTKTGGDSGADGKPIKIGFIALTDCSSIVMAEQLGYFKEKGLDVQVIKQASWPATRDNLLNGEIDAAHCLFSMPTSLAAGIGGKPDQILKIAMVLNNNGQSITLKKDLAGVGYADLKGVKSTLGKSKRTLAMTFPGGTHDTWLRYWLLAAGIGMDDIKIIPIPPPQMVANMKVGTMDGFCVGEPWNAQAVQEDIGFTAINTQDIWQHHPEKALIVRPNLETERRDDLKAVMSAVLKASRWLDEPDNRKRAAMKVGVPAFVGAKPQVIEGRMLGKYDLGAGLGSKTYTEDYMRFFRDGKTNAPRRAHAIWFLAQYRRFGYLKQDPAYREIADRLVLSDLYQEVASAEGIAVPDDDMAPFEVKLDGVEFDPNSPEKEATRV
ncbi:MAG: CmpA/NrtA family ABC transporter substrate-binding protein [Actinomycetota bacterium]